MDAGYLFLVLFAITLFVLYIAVRRAWGHTLYNGLVGAILSMVFVILFSLTSEKTVITEGAYSKANTSISKNSRPNPSTKDTFVSPGLIC